MFSSTTWLLSFLAVVMVAACSSPSGMARESDGPREKATLAGGCFWCMEPPYEGLDGVISVVSGYSGGDEVDPTYEEVARGLTGHCEAVQITFNPQIISYEDLLQVYWKSMDPTDAGGQFADRGAHYRPVIFYHDERQKKAAQQSMRKLASSGRFDDAVAVEITAFSSWMRLATRAMTLRPCPSSSAEPDAKRISCETFRLIPSRICSILICPAATSVSSSETSSS